MNSIDIINKAKERYLELSQKNLDWKSFYTGYLEGAMTQRFDLLEAYKTIVKSYTYIQDGDRWCDVCGGVDDKYASDKILHLDEDCIVLKTEQYIKENK